jgi:hypothetical protein
VTEWLSRLSELVLSYSVERMSAQVLPAATEVTVATARPPWGVVGRGYRLLRQVLLAAAEVTVATARPPWGVVGRGYRLPGEAALAGAAGAA